jgi:molybdate transport system substrate-binding protein
MQFFVVWGMILHAHFTLQILRFALVSSSLLCANATAQRTAAASDLQPILDPLIAEYNAQHRANATVTYGSSGKLATQIESGAPFAVYLSADSNWMQRVATRPRVQGRKPVKFAQGRLALVAPKNSAVCSAGLAAIANENTKFAIAQPEHAPYGRAAKETLERAGQWQTLVDAKRVVMADSVANAAQWIVTGVASAGLVGWTHAQKFTNDRFCVQKVPTAQHSPLEKEVLAVAREGEPFVVWLTQPRQLQRFAAAGLAQ